MSHVPNLFESDLTKCGVQATSLFNTIAEIYNLLSGSIQRWAKMIACMKNKVYVVKSLSQTWWSALASLGTEFIRSVRKLHQQLQSTLQQNQTKFTKHLFCHSIDWRQR